VIFPALPAALLLSLAPAAILLVLAHWRLAQPRSNRTFWVVAFGVGVALVAASIGEAASCSFGFLRPFRDSPWSLTVALAPYVFVLFAMARSRQLSVSLVAVCGVVGLLPLYFLGLYALLLAACAYGDCL
jgi:hypothetical protein